MSFLSDAKIVTHELNEFFQDSITSKRPVINQQPLEQIIVDLKLESFAKDGGLTGDQLTAFLKRYFSTATALYHPGYMAHQVAVPHPNGALGSLIDGFTANPMAIYEMGPGSTSIEYFVINWMLKKVGWIPAPDVRDSFQTESGSGILTHGGSLANLTALTAARNKIAPEAWELGVPGDLALLVSPASHYSVARAAGILGIGQKAIYHLEVDARGAVRPDQLNSIYDRVIQDGRRPMAVVVNACQTATGIHDPLQAIASFCNDRQIWLHVDGAHGASALLSEKYRFQLKGIEQADSLIWDTHKMMCTPTLCAALLVKDHNDLNKVFKQEASYLFHQKEQPGIDMGHQTVECTKAALGLRFFMVLGAMGESGLAQHIDRQYDLAAYAYEFIHKQSDFEVPLRPETNILCFRIAGSDHLQIKIRDELIARGQFYISSANVFNRRYLRLALMNPATTQDEIHALINSIRAIAKELRIRS